MNTKRPNKNDLAPHDYRKLLIDKNAMRKAKDKSEIYSILSSIVIAQISSEVMVDNLSFSLSDVFSKFGTRSACCIDHIPSRARAYFKMSLDVVDS